MLPFAWSFCFHQPRQCRKGKNMATKTKTTKKNELLCVVTCTGHTLDFGFIAYNGGDGPIRTYEPGQIDGRLVGCRTFKDWKTCGQYLLKKATRKGSAYAALPVAVAEKQFRLKASEIADVDY